MSGVLCVAEVVGAGSHRRPAHSSEAEVKTPRQGCFRRASMRNFLKGTHESSRMVLYIKLCAAKIILYLFSSTGTVHWAH